AERIDQRQLGESMPQRTERDEGNQEPKNWDQSVKFSVCAVTDLQGFSSHLEISGYDLRTDIGEHAILRLRNLEEAVDRMNDEQSRRPDYYLVGLYIRRINDAIIIAMDLDDALLPSLGQTVFRGLPHGVEDPFKPDEPIDWQIFRAVNDAKFQQAIEPLQRFLGLVSRLHLFVQKCEGNGYYPGAKTVVTTGFRKPFISSSQGEDLLSANSAFANAVVAEKELKGPHLFVDNHVVELLSKNQFARNILRFAHFQWAEAAFDCLTDDADPTNPPSRAEMPKPLEVFLFRRRYLFRRLNASPTSYLQNLPSLAPFLLGLRRPEMSNCFYAHIYDAIRHGLSKRMIEESSPPSSFIFNGTNDLDVDVAVFEEFIATGESATKEAKCKARRLAERGLEPGKDSELIKKLDELEQQTVEVNIEQIDVGENLSEILSLSEEQLTAFLLILNGDMSLLDFPYESE
ncbi:MAG: hypothetical protein ACXW18_05680, partial [Pyrinomonadaceae bacterium]